jgi:hypothetical protein
MTPSKKPKPERRSVSIISVPDARPDDGLFNPFKEAKAAEMARNADPTQPIPTQPIPTQPIPAQTDPTQANSIAAARDFNRRHNSLDRDALPAGLFPGTSQKLYNALFLKTRGAIVPRRTVQATKRELMLWSNIRSKNTIAVNLNILTSLGWIKAEHDVGSHEGSVYEVFTFEELPNPSQPIPTHPDPTQKLGLDPTQKLGWVGLGNTLENKGTYGDPKTSFNTKEEKFDDEAGARRLAAKLTDAERELTGKVSTTPERWEELAEVMIAELRIAAARTTVSNVPAFLAEHLRRRLWKVDKQRAAELVASEPERGSVLPALTAEERRKCPDCAGIGFWYPEGPEKGVAKCRHASLSPAAEEGDSKGF